MVSAALALLSLTLSAAATPATRRAVPQTISLTSRQAASPFARRALSPIEVPLKDYFNGTDLQ